MIIVKKVNIPPEKGTKMGIEYIFLEGVQGYKQSIGAKIDRIKGGEYLVFYRTNFQPFHKCRKLNLVFSGTNDMVNSTKVLRLKPTMFKPGFFETQLRNLESRQFLQGHF